MIKKNNKTVGFIYKNNQNIDKIYKNNQLIFEQGFVREDSGNVPLSTTYQAIGKNLKDYKIYGNSVQGKLPDIYQQVEYIESTGTQYIDTGIYTNTTLSKFEIKLNISNKNVTAGVFGTRNYKSSDKSAINVFIRSGSLRLDWLSGSSVPEVAITENIDYTISITRGLATINNINYTNEENTSVDARYPFYIGNLNNAGIPYETGLSGKIYYSKLYNNNILVFDGVPCYRKSDNVIGMYDLVTNTFFTNAGTGVFLKGSNAPTPSAPIEIESVGDKTKNLFNYKTASTYKGSFDNNGVFHATDNDNRDNLVYKIQLYNGNTMVTNSSRNISITGTGTYRITSPKLIQSGTTRIRFANHGTSIEFSINCDIDGSQFVGQYASIVFTVDDATVGASVISDIMFYVGNEPFDYEPYGYKIPVIVGNTTTNIYLDEPLRKIGDYADYIDFKNSKVVRNIAKKVLNGTEDWGMPGTIISDYSSYRIVNFIPNLPLQTPIEELLCTHFEAFPKSQYQQEPIQNKVTSYGNTNQIIILISNNIADSNNQTTTTNWINWLSNNNITLYYSKQPTEETVALPNIPTIKGTTIFEIDTEIQPSSMYIKYKSK